MTNGNGLSEQIWFILNELAEAQTRAQLQLDRQQGRVDELFTGLGELRAGLGELRLEVQGLSQDIRTLSATVQTQSELINRHERDIQGLVAVAQVELQASRELRQSIAQHEGRLQQLEQRP